MRFQSLKTNIAVYLALFLLISIGLTDFSVVRIIQGRMIERKIVSGQNLIRQIDKDLALGNISFATFASLVEQHYQNDFKVMYIGLMLPDGKRIAHGRIDQRLQNEIYRTQEHVMRTGASMTRYFGDTWGVFWKQKKFGIVTIPLNRHRGTGSVLIAFDPIYQMLRSTQKMVIIYMFINFLIILLLGTYRIFRMVIRPIHRYIKISESFVDSEHFDFFPEKKHNEFSRLSLALNRMLQRIDGDTRKLQNSLKALEKANAELKTVQREVVRAEKLASIGRLSAGIAHEIGNPIGIVLGYLELLKTKITAADDTNGLDYIQRAEYEINRINVIIRQLLNFSRTTSVEISDVSIHHVIRDIVDILQHQPLTADISVGMDLSASKDRVYADYHQIHQVIMNLAINAADSISQSERASQGVIRFSTSLVSDGAGKSLCVRVQDNGEGIDKAHLDKIFDPFFTTKEPGKGTGLGLSVCYMIIEQSGGTISAESTPGVGTTIILHLPLVEENHQSTSSETHINEGLH